LAFTDRAAIGADGRTCAFLCPRYRAGIYRTAATGTGHWSPQWFLCLGIGLAFTGVLQLCGPVGAVGGLYALGIGLAFTALYDSWVTAVLASFLCPRYRAGVYSCRSAITVGTRRCFYALGIGLAFTVPPRSRRSSGMTRFYALGIGLAFTAG